MVDGAGILEIISNMQGYLRSETSNVDALYEDFKVCSISRSK